MAFVDGFGVAHDDSALELVVALALPVTVLFPVFLAVAPVFVFPVFALLPLRLVETHLVEEATNHALEELGLIVTVLFGPLIDGLVAVFTSLAPLLLSTLPSFFHLSPIRLLIRRCGVTLSILIEDSDNH